MVGLPDGGLGLSTSNGVLELLEVQPAGGRHMTGPELVRGRPGIVTYDEQDLVFGPVVIADQSHQVHAGRPGVCRRKRQ